MRCTELVHQKWGVPYSLLTWAAHLILQDAASKKVHSWRTAGQNGWVTSVQWLFTKRTQAYRSIIFFLFDVSPLHIFLLFFPSDTWAMWGAEDDAELVGALCCLLQSSAGPAPCRVDGETCPVSLTRRGALARSTWGCQSGQKWHFLFPELMNIFICGPLFLNLWKGFNHTNFQILKMKQYIFTRLLPFSGRRVTICLASCS